jgi:ABC-type enterochelin transport system permease subunit
MVTPTSAEETYEQFRARFDAALITTYAVAMTVVPLKIWCRKRTGGWSNMGLDELFTLMATIFVTAIFSVIMSGESFACCCSESIADSAF